MARTTKKALLDNFANLTEQVAYHRGLAQAAQQEGDAVQVAAEFAEAERWTDRLADVAELVFDAVNITAYDLNAAKRQAKAAAARRVDAMVAQR